LIDLHLHTNASDGRLTPGELIARAAAAALTVVSVTDHDTVAGLAAARAAAEPAGLTFVDGIEVTAVHAHRDVHVLGYFIDPQDADFDAFLRLQRSSRVDRVREIGRRLEQLGAGVDVDRLLETAARRAGASVGRPAIARALVETGQARTLSDAFDRFLAAGRPAFVPRTGPEPAVVVDAIHRAGGVASLAHPGLTAQPEIIEPLAAAGLDALEVFHPEHPPDTQSHMLQLATRLGLLITGGSDFHGEDDRDRPLGGRTLPREHFERLRDAAARRAR
jgi:predicted metal-dependent phosphoesterase TrpH